MKQGKLRTMSICLTDIKELAADKIVKGKNGKLYIHLRSWDNDEPDQFENDFSITVSQSKEEVERYKAGEEVKRVYVGNGRIWEPNTQQADQSDIDDLPF